MTGVRRARFRFGLVRGDLLLIAVAVFTAACACVTTPPVYPLTSGSFLGPRDFTGSYTPRSHDAVAGGRATYRGTIVFTNLNRSLVESVLPPELKLAQNSASPNLHPVIFLNGHPENSSWFIASTPIMPGPSYDELMLLVPFVVATSGTRWHTLVVRMYLDDETAIWIGNTFFGYAKEPGTSQESGSELTGIEVTQRDAGGTAKFHAVTAATGPAHPDAQAATTIPNYGAIKAILAMPIVGKHAVLGLVCSYFELNFTNAMVAPVRSAHEFLSPFVPPMAGWLSLGTLSSVPDGAVGVQNVDWRIEQPPAPPCQF
jgi:hypothetical protein